MSGPVGGSASAGDRLTVAVTGPTGTFGAGLLPLLEDDDLIARVVGIARRPFDPGPRGWTKMTYRQGDVRDAAGLADAVAGADVVVHLAFLIRGDAPRSTTRAINVEGTLNAYRAAAAAGARRFVYASSIAAYGFGADLPEPIGEDWPVRPADRLFYAREKAELEGLLTELAAAPGAPELLVLRPCVVVGGSADGPGGRRRSRLPLPVPLPVPELRLQLVHADDVGRALQLCVLGAGPPGAYNIAGDGVLSLGDVVREFGGYPVRLPASPAHLTARALARLPLLPPAAEWIEALASPVIVDTARARRLLSWQPRYTGLEALRAALAAG